MSDIQKKIADIQAKAAEDARNLKIKAAEDIKNLKIQAASGIVKRLAEAKEELKAATKKVADLKKEYAAATGKTVKGEIPRRRLSAEEKTALAVKVQATLKANKAGSKLGMLVSTLGESQNAIRDAIKTLGKNVTKTGNKASTLYFAK